MGPCGFLNRLFVRVLSYRSLVQPVLEINLDVYNVCIARNWRPGELAFASVWITFGTPLPSDFQHNFTLGVLMYFTSRTSLRCGTIDLFIFVIILVTARGPRTNRFPGIPSILDAILRDVTLHFLLIFAFQMVFFMFLFFAPVGDPHYIRGGCCTHRLCTFRSKFGTCPDCRFSPPLKQRRSLSD